MQIYSSFNPDKHRNYYKRPFHKTRGCYLLLILIIGIAAFIYWSIKTPRPDENLNLNADLAQDVRTTAQVNYIKGKLLVEKDNKWEELTQNSNINKPNSLKTEADSRATILLPDNSLLRLNANAKLTLQDFGLSDIIVTQNQGQVFYRTSDKSPAIYRVRKNNVELTALGTGFNVNVTDKTMELMVTEGRVKVKIFNPNKDTEILNMKTVEEGSLAIINLEGNPQTAITLKVKTASDLLDDEWFVWNKTEDEAHDMFLGIFAETIPLTITEPQKAEFETDQTEIVIKGTTQPQAEIYFTGTAVTNLNGTFEQKVKLNSGENKIEILVKQGKQKNKKILYITCTKKEMSVNLKAVNINNRVHLTWTITNPDPKLTGFRSVKGLVENPAFPAADYHELSAEKRADDWEALPAATYFFRLCAFIDNQCQMYSANVKAIVE